MLEDVTTNFKENFQGVGCYKEPYSIKLDPTIKPVIQPPRRLPYTKLDTIKAYLDKLENNDIITSVDEPTEWVSNLVITEKKNGSLRICLDPRPLNTAIKREHYIIPTAADV